MVPGDSDFNLATFSGFPTAVCWSMLLAHKFLGRTSWCRALSRLQVFINKTPMCIILSEFILWLPCSLPAGFNHESCSPGRCQNLSALQLHRLYLSMTYIHIYIHFLARSAEASATASALGGQKSLPIVSRTALGSSFHAQSFSRPSLAVGPHQFMMFITPWASMLF